MLLVVLLGALLVFSEVLSSPAAQAEPTPENLTTPVDITLDSVSPDYLGEDDSLTLTGTLTNHGDAPLTDVIVWWRMQTHVPTEDGLTQWLRDENETNVVTLARHDLETDLDPGKSTTYEIVIPPEESPFDYGSTWGPRGIEMVVSATEDDANARVRAQTRSTIIWYPEDASTPARLTVGVPLTPTESEWSRALREKTSLPEVSAPRIAEITRTLEGYGVLWGVDAALLDEVPADRLHPFLPPENLADDPAVGTQGEESTEDSSGESAPPPPQSPAGVEPADETPGSPGPSEQQSQESEDPDAASPPLQWEPSPAAAELARSIREAAGSQKVISLGWAQPDLTGLLRGGSAGARIYDRNITRAQEILATSQLRADSEVVWSVSELDRGTIARLGSDTSVLLLPPTPAGSEFAPADSPNLSVRSPEAGLVDLLSRDIPPGELLARTAIAARGASSSLLVTLPPTLTGEQAAQLSENLSVLRGTPWLETAPLRPNPAASNPATSEPGASSDPSAPNSPGRPASGESPLAAPPGLTDAQLTRLAEALDAANAFAELTEDPPLISSLFETTALLAASNVWNTEEELPGRLIDTVEQAAHAKFLAIEQPSDVNLISQGGDLPVSVINTGPLTLHSLVTVEPEDARLREDAPVTAELGPGQTTTVRVPVTAVANGNVEATVRLLNPDGQEVAASREFTIRVRADWETTGTAALAGLLAAGFLFGIFRNIRRSKSSSRPSGGHDG